MKKSLLVSTILLTASSMAHAGLHDGFYLGGDRVNTAISFNNIGNKKLDNNGFKIKGGYAFGISDNTKLNLEGAYTKYGRLYSDFYGSTNDGYELEGKQSISLSDKSVITKIAYYPFESFNLYIAPLASLNFMQSNIHFEGTETTNYYSSIHKSMNNKQSGVSFGYGLELGYEFDVGLGVDVSYNVINDVIISGLDLTAVNVGMYYKF